MGDSNTTKQEQIGSVTLIPKASVNLTTFKILITGPEDVIPVLARQLKTCINDIHNITNLKIHHTVCLNEEIAKRLSKDGLHAVVLCTDASKTLTKSYIQETLKHLDFDLLSSSLFILNFINPLPATFPSVVDAVEKVSTVYNTHIVNILYEDVESMKFGLNRIAAAALRSAKFIYGYQSLTFKNVDIPDTTNSAH